MNRIKEILGRLTWPLAILIVGAYGAFTYFTLDHAEVQTRSENIESVNAQIENHKSEMKRLAQFEKEFDEKKKKFNELVSELQRMQAALPRQFIVPDLLADLYAEADKVKLEVKKISVAREETVKPLYNELTFEVEVRGTFLQIFVFLDRLASMKRLVNVSYVNVKREQSAQGKITLGGTNGAFAETGMPGGTALYPRVTGNIKVVTYRYKGSQGAPATPATPAGAPSPGSPPGPRGGGNR